MGSPSALPPRPSQAQVPARRPLYLPRRSSLPLSPPPAPVCPVPFQGSRPAPPQTPPPLQSGSTPRGGAGGPPPRLWSAGAAPQPPAGGGRTGARLRAPPDQATGHPGSGGQEAGLAERGSGPGRCGLRRGRGGLRGRGLRLQPRGGPGAARGLGQFTSLQWGPAHITGAAAARRRRAPLGCRVSCLLLLLLLRGPPA